MRVASELSFLVPLGETNEEFYQGIYTGQPLPARPPTYLNPPPLPSQPPVWRPEQSMIVNDDREERDGPSWVCTMCTFDNHPLMNKCEECDMPRLLNDGSAGTLQRVNPQKTEVSSTSSLSSASNKCT